MGSESGDRDTILVRQYARQVERDHSYESLKGHRACLECRRKKTKCDMLQPTCGLCQRTGGSCTFPTKRKTPEFKHPHTRDPKKKKINPERLERLVDLLESRLESRLTNGQDFDHQSPLFMASDTREPDSHSGHAQFDALPSHESTSSGSDGREVYDHSRSSSRTPTHVADDLDHWDLPSCPQASDQEADWFTVPEQLAIELIHLYFDKIQPCIPLLHRPNFFARYIGNDRSSLLNPAAFSNQDALLIYGILALAARHSSNERFHGVSAPDRGNQFAKKATELYSRLRATEEHSSLMYLQGCVLLAVYLCASGPCHRGWILTGVCVRMAYDLDLCNMDEGDDTWQGAAEWMAIEERRRLFWIVWELDTFVSTLSRRPSAINRQRMAVHLPVSDGDWFAQEPVKSAPLGTRPSEVWKSLLDSPNQNERAWFLLANYLMAITYETASSGRARQDEQEELVDALICFNLAMSQRFSLETHAVLFDSESLTKHNWIIGMHLMLMSAHACLSGFGATHSAGSLIHTREFSRIIQHWHPETVALSHPFLACTLFIPQASLPNETLQPFSTLKSNIEMSRLMLAQYGSVWKLGSVLIDLTRLFNPPDTLSDEERALMKRLAVFFPNRTTSHRPKLISHAPLPVNKEDTIMGNHAPVDEMPSKQPLELLELFNQPDDLENHGVLVDDLSQAAIEGTAEFQLDVQDDWSSRLQLDYLCDDNQHFNYLQL
ncbi:fungal-specific transcription factor domain-containing protein [Dactylonectria estremocensis]|uniref:Fungal-specific transcription factor domain-containing protein n=1 Tax=Dactylonectria estremocensis TaxID=1079267 RepID=A0A9P9FHV4_9HYPO|nr:fungal-specific transcription factor domain-containing protein [Dactylonectria estremocensis]